MKKVKKKALIIVASCMFALMMMFNVNVSMENESMNTDVSLSSMSALAISTSSETEVLCNCAAWYQMNRNCTARNNGNRCSSTEDCRSADEQCG